MNQVILRTAARSFLPVWVALGIEIAMAAATQGDAVERGHNFVQQNCAICHAVERVGASPNPLAPPFRELHTRYPVENLQEAFAEGIVVGHPAMPMFTLDPQAIGDLIAYLKSLER